MACPPELVGLLTEMIGRGILHVRVLASAGRADWLGYVIAESDHVRQLPSILAAYSPDRLASYWDTDRPAYLAAVPRGASSAWQSSWDRLRRFVGGDPDEAGRREVSHPGVVPDGMESTPGRVAPSPVAVPGGEIVWLRPAEPLYDSEGPIPEFPPFVVDEGGNFLPIPEGQRAARADALRRSLDAIASMTDETDEDEDAWREVMTNLGIEPAPAPLTVAE